MKKTIKNKEKSYNLITFFTTFFMYFLIGEILIIVTGFLVIRELSVGLPGIEELERIPDAQELSSVIYSGDNVELKSFREEINRYWVEYDTIPQCMIDAVTSTEDSRFFSHWGVSLPDILRAAKENIIHLRKVQGASTITQQLSRDLFLNRDQTFRRKLKEMIVASKIEHTYSKPEILEIYLNRMFFGNNSYGIQAAARGYYGKNASELNLSEAALLAGILQTPTRYNPRSSINSPQVQLKIAKNRRDTVLIMMARAGKIPFWRAKEEMVKPVELSDLSEYDYGKAPYFVDHIRRFLEEKYGEDFVYKSGARVYTTLNYSLQEIAEKALREQLANIQNIYADKIPYTRSNKNLTGFEAVQDSLAKKVVQGALVALDVKTGQVLAMVGGREFSDRNQFNRSTQARRQAGSSFKPFLYTAALDNGWRCCDTIYDGYVSYPMYDGTVWEPRNFDGEYLGVVSLRYGFKNSRNIVAVKLMNDEDNHGIGARNVILYAHKMGINTYIPEVRSIAIGSAEVKLIEMVSAYTVFPNFGIKTDNFSIKRIYDKNNLLIYQQTNGEKSEVLRPEVASLMITMMKGVTSESKGTAAAIIGNSVMKDRPCAGKTGTAQDFKDAWFIGYTPYIACGVWIGFDSEETTLRNPLHTGATAALPVWINFMSKASEVLGYPKDDFKLSKNITIRRLCRDSYLLAGPNCPDSAVYNEYFIPGTEVTTFCNVHNPKIQGSPNSRFISDDFQKRR